MDILEFKLNDGTIEKVPCLQFQISVHQQIMVMGTDFNDRKSMLIQGGAPGVEAEAIGKLEDQNTLFEIMITNSLKKYDWNLQAYPNPEVILLTDKRILN